MNLPSPTSEEPIPGYRLISRIGRGGYGEVWRVEAPGGIHKAIKFVFGDLEGIGRESTGAEQEYKSLHRVKSIRHPFILSIERFDVVDGQLLIVMELADSNLWDRFGDCQRQGMVGIPRKELLGYMSEAAEALDLMNQQYNIQHLDIKPQNLFLLHNHIKVADFGLAKDLEGLRATVTGGMTPVYAPPETFEGWISRNSDQYSLAIVYQELLTGVRPFSGSKPRELLFQHLQAEPNVGTLPQADQGVIRKALSKNPDQRYATCKEMVEALIENQGLARTIVPVQKPDPMALTPRPVTTPHRESIPTPLPNEKPKIRQGAMPPLITPKSKDKSNQPAPLTIQSSEVIQTQRMPRLGFAPPEQNGSGVLYPAIYVGIGKFGLETLKRMRKLIFQRFGRTTFPHWRWLFIDTDMETIQDATTGSPEIALSTTETLHVRLHRSTHYQRSNGTPYEKWLPSEILYRIPREPSTLGIRSLGRLAFFSNINSIIQRLRGEIEHFLREDLMNEAETLTGLPMRTNRPRTHLITSLSGGTGSGMLIDLAYLIKWELQKVGYLSPKVFANLGASPTLSGPAMANAAATLKEIEYFSRPQTVYSETFETDSEPFFDKEGPFTKCLILPHSTKVPNTEILAHLLVTDALTTCGKVIESSSRLIDPHRNSTVPFTTANIRRIVWPRSRLLQNTTQQLACRILESWQGSLSEDQVQTINQEFTEWSLNYLEPGQVSSRLEQAGEQELGQIPSQFFSTLIGSLSSQKLDSQTCHNLLERLHGLLGNPQQNDLNEKSELEKSMNRCVEKLIQEVDAAILSKTVKLIERPSLRLSGADFFLKNLEGYLKNQLENLNRWMDSLLPQCHHSYSELYDTLLSCGFRKEGKSKSQIKQNEELNQNLISKFLGWATARYRLIAADSAREFYTAIYRRMPEYTREISFCRLQADEYLKKFALTHTISDSPIDQPVLPVGSSTLELAAESISREIPYSEIILIDNLLQEEVKKEFRALVHIFLKPNEYGQLFLNLLQDKCREYLDAKLEKANALQAVYEFLPSGLIRNQFLQKTFERSKLKSKTAPETPSLHVIALPESEHRTLLQSELSALFASDQPLFANADQEIIFWTEGLYTPPQVTEKFDNHPTPSRFDLNF